MHCKHFIARPQSETGEPEWCEVLLLLVSAGSWSSHWESLE